MSGISQAEIAASFASRLMRSGVMTIDEVRDMALRAVAALTEDENTIDGEFTRIDENALAPPKERP